MRIALVAENYYPHMGGIPEHVHHLALELNARGHDTVVITARMGDVNDAPFVRRIGRSLVIYANAGMARLTEGRTSVIIAHRLSTIQKADRILVLHRGAVRESRKIERRLHEKKTQKVGEQWARERQRKRSDWSAGHRRASTQTSRQCNQKTRGR